MTDTLILAAVAYDAKVVTIWDGFQKWFAARGLAFDYVLYSNYERQVEQHFDGAFHVAWNSPLAWLQTDRIAKARGRTARAVAMRDTDMDLSSVLVVRADSKAQTVADLRGTTLGLLADRDFRVRRFDVLVGKHGDHIGGERDAAKALMTGEVDAACMIDSNHLLFTQEGTLPRAQTRVLSQTGLFDHCNVSVLDGAPESLVARFCDLLLSMRYDDPVARPLLDLEGLKQWRPGRTNGYATLARSCDRFRWIDRFVQSMQP